MDSVVCWGSNTSGQLGDRSMKRRAVPTAVIDPLAEMEPHGVHGADGSGGKDAIHALSAAMPSACMISVPIGGI